MYIISIRDILTNQWMENIYPNEFNRHDLTEIVLKVALNTIKPNLTERIQWK